MKDALNTLLLLFSLSTSVLAYELVHAKQLSSKVLVSKSEGAVCDEEGNLYFCNLKVDGQFNNNRGNIGILKVGKTEPELFMTLPEGMRGNGLRFGPEGNLYMADQLGCRTVKIDMKHKTTTVLQSLEIKSGFVANQNDVAMSQSGALYVSTQNEGFGKST